MDDLEEAYAEALTYNRMGALTEELLNDIAFDYDVEPEDILEKLGWGRDHYSKRK